MGAGQIVRDGHFVKLNRKQQATLASSTSYWWGEELRANPKTKFPPRADHAPMRTCQSDSRNGVHVAPANCLSIDRRTKKRLCEDCLALNHERWMRRLKDEGLLDSARMNEVERKEMLRKLNLPTTSSPTGEAMMALEDAHAQVLEMKLVPEDAEALSRQIERYRRLAAGVGEKRAVVMVFGEENERITP